VAPLLGFQGWTSVSMRVASRLTAVTTPQAARFACSTGHIVDNADFSVQLIDLYEFFSAQFVISWPQA
jgi:hypothetical protein